ncbi:MAG TPA: CoA-binding protein [Ramlibacter sp.]|uniref:CoA-binding protein n=1 Tax=Ramlibacter sp. TaxID=1917967 RepID=UPI002BF20900|nr:CoA-binding protein [Ramlibacter sp.]HVZ46823.1 CoA-binding protein [Ramlibacter sp.]
MSDSAFDALFDARSIGVIGASPDGDGPANNFIAHLRTCGFEGPIHPIHPNAESIAGLKAYRSPADLPLPVDYLYVAIGAARVPAAIASARGRARVAQVISSGFGETEEGRALERELVEAARSAGVRVIGPNSLGTHAPRCGLTFVDRALREPGSVGVLSQSGGLAADIVRRGQGKGVRFSGVVSVGNCADVRVAELLRYLQDDPHTRVIGLYLENAGEAPALFDILRGARGAKPVVVLKGGRTAQGQAAAASHTGALASDFRLWEALCRQTGACLVESLDEFVDALLAFQMLRARQGAPTKRVVLFGNGGGTSVLATDDCVRHGLDVARFDDALIARLAALGLPPGAIVSNPIDVPANALRAAQGSIAGRILDEVLAAGASEAVIMHVNITVVLGYQKNDLLGNLMEAARGARERHPGDVHFVLVLRSDGEVEAEEARRRYRARALACGIPVFDEPAAAARALAAVGWREGWLARRNLPRDR